MESPRDDRGEDAVAKAVKAASLARSAQKKAEKAAKEALEVARRELKQKEKIINLRKAEMKKKTVNSYFQSSRGMAGGQPLSLVFDGCMHEVPGAEPMSEEEYPSDKEGGQLMAPNRNISLATDTPCTPGSSFESVDTIVLSCKSPMITISESSSDKDNSQFVEVPIQFEGSSDDSDFESPPLKQAGTSRTKSTSSRSEAQSRYDLHRKFQTIWAAKLPWAEGIMGNDGILHMVKCKVCSVIDRKPCVMAPKSDTLFKHDGKRTAKKDLPQYKVKAGEQYVATQCKHRKNMRLYAAKPALTVLQQINQCSNLEARKKRVQFATLFQLLADGRPVAEFESRQALYKLLGVPDLPVAHWCVSSGWIMAGYMYKQVVEETKRLIASTRYIALTVDEITAVDNSSFLSVHAYIVQDWIRIPLLISLERVNCSPNAENITELIVGSLHASGAMDVESVASKLLSFGADGASTLQGARTGVTHQIKEKHAPFMIGVHCMAHRCNLAFKALSGLRIFSDVEKLLSVTHSYFCKSPKRYSEFRLLAELTETKGLKMLRNVQTRWVSLIEPLRRLLSEYRTLIYKMTADLNDNNKAEACLQLLLDPFTLLGMCALLPLLEAIDTLVLFAQKRDVYVCDFLAAVKLCQASLYRMYQDKETAYSTDEFWSFTNLLDYSHEQIHIKWITNHGDNSAVLSFICHGEHIHAEHKGSPVDREVWATLLAKVKSECTGAANVLVAELDARFPAHNIMNAFGIFYPQYWCQPNAEDSFDSHLRTLMDTYGHDKIIGEGDKKILVKALIDRETLISQRALFKTCMKSNARAAMLPPFDLNPLTKVWRVLHSNNSLTQNFCEFVKLAEMAVVQVLGSVEDERLFSSVNFLKSKLHNNLEEHIQVVVGMFSQRIFTLDNFPYQKVFDDWFVAGGRGRYLAGV